ncbi:MAG: phosphatase PAP2 family protein [Dehalococcoidia bacterium]
MILARNRYLTELALIAAGYLFYIGIKQFFVQDLEVIAFENARKIINLEVLLKLHWEQPLQDWLLHNHRNVIVFFNWVYTLGFFPILIPAAVILFVSRYPTYVHYRNVFLISYAITWLVYLTFPTAPPRMMGEHGYIDTIQQMGPAIYNSKETISYYNQFSAMPSMHFGWTLLFGILFLRSKYLPLKIFGAVYPILSLVAIVVTANHYLLDALVGGLIILFSFAIYHLLKKAVLPQLAAQTSPVLSTRLWRA